MSKASPKAPAGMRDFLPADVKKRRYVRSIIEEVYESHGFAPLETPAMEKRSTLEGKYGEEGEKLVFRVMLRGDKIKKALERGASAAQLADLALRYDLTVPLARVVAEHGEKLGRVFKRYQIQPVWRADRPGRNRFREFMQCDVDIVGTTSLLAEVEVLSAALEIMDRLGFPEYRLHVNHRVVLRQLVASSGISPEHESQALIAIDKWDKVGTDGVLSELRDAGMPEEVLERLSGAFIEPVPLEEAHEELIKPLELSDEGRQALSDLRALARYLRKWRINVVWDPHLARGLDYYTGPIFEMRLPDVNVSVGGGGRYDELIGMFAGRTIPAVGFSVGFDRIVSVMDESGLFPQSVTEDIPVLLGVLGEDSADYALEVARKLRDAGMAVDLYPEFASPSKVFKFAHRRGFRKVMLVGETEARDRTIAMKDMVSGERATISLENLIHHE